MPIPYRIAVLVYIVNAQGQLLLLHRKKKPNKDMYSPIGGKLEQHAGESPYACALREIREEIGVQLKLDDIRLMGIVSERAYASEAGGESHWLMFCFEVTRPLAVPLREFEEGRLEWVDPRKILELSIPSTDRQVIWPLVQRHSRLVGAPAGKPPCEGFFSVHIDCTDAKKFTVVQEEPHA